MDPQRVELLKSRIVPAESVLMVAHDYPDPDCLASAKGLSHLMKWWGVESTLTTFGGFVGRAENRAMIRYLDFDTLPLALVHPEDFERIVVVDAYPGAGNLSLPTAAPVDAVFDHHLKSSQENAPFFQDIRPDAGATSTIVAQYLLAAQCPITPEVATALFYGIKTDTGDMGREASKEDFDCYKLLFDRIDHQKLALIENPDRDIDFFRTVHDAAASAVCFDTVGFTHLGKVSSPDHVAEMADFFQSLERLEWMICSGIFKKSLFFSVRSKRQGGAGERAELIAGRLGGSGGGHGRIGAGRVPLDLAGQPDSVDGFVETFKDVFRISSVQKEPMLGDSAR